MADIIPLKKSVNIGHKLAELGCGDARLAIYGNEALDDYRKTGNLDSLVWAVVAKLKMGDDDGLKELEDEAVLNAGKMRKLVINNLLICLQNRFDMDRWIEAFNNAGHKKDLPSLSRVSLGLVDLKQAMNFPGFKKFGEKFMKEDASDEYISFVQGLFDILKNKFKNNIFAFEGDIAYEDDNSSKGDLFLKFFTSDSKKNRLKMEKETIDLLNKWCKDHGRDYSSVPFFFAVYDITCKGTGFSN